jgi:hypothetical protein
MSDSYRGSTKRDSTPFPDPGSPSVGLPRTVIIGGPKSYTISESNSDEVVMLEDMGRTGRKDIVKQTEVEVSFHEIP